MRFPILAALVSALLFGVSTPVAKVLVVQVPPVALAGLLYLGAGVGLLGLRWAIMRVSDRDPGTPREAPVAGTDWGWLAGAILAGGVIAPVLLMVGLQHTPGSTATPLLNLEGVFTALLDGAAPRQIFPVRPGQSQRSRNSGRATTRFP